MEVNVKIEKKNGEVEMTKLSAHEKYQRENIQRVVLKLNKNTDGDILEWINSQDNKQGSIKELIRRHIAENK